MFQLAWPTMFALVSLILPMVSGQEPAQTPSAATPKNAALKKPSPAALAMYSDAANFQNNGAWEVAAEEWVRFLKLHGEVDLAPKAQFYLGVCNMQLKRYAMAVAAFATVVDKYPKFNDREGALLNLGWCRYTIAYQEEEAHGVGPAALKLYEQAATTMTAMLKEFPPGKGRRGDEGLFYLGESLYRQNKKQPAVDAYRRLVKEYPQSRLRADGLYALGVTSEELDQFAAAGATYDLFIKEFSQHALMTEVRMRRAETLLQVGLTTPEANRAKELLARAESMFGEVAEVEGFSSVDRALFRQALCVLKQDRSVEAAKLYARVASDFTESPHAAESAIAAARAYFNGERYDEAKQWFQKVYEGGGDNAAEAAHWICHILLNSRQGAAAAALAAQALPKASGGDFEVYLKMDRADGLFDSPGKGEQALAMYLKVVADHGSHEQAAIAQYYAAFTALDLKRYEEGLKYATEFLAAQPGHRLTVDTLHVAAECHLQLSHYAKAEAIFRQLTQQFDQHELLPSWRVRLGLCLYLQGKYQVAIDSLKPHVASLKKPELVAQCWHVIGSSQYYLDQFAPASESLAAALAADSHWRQADETMLLLSRCQRGMDKIDEAIRTVRKMIVQYEQSAAQDQAHYRLAEYTFTSGDMKKAISQYDLVIQKWPKSIYVPFAYYGKGWAQLQSDLHGQAVESLGALIQQFPKHQLVPEAQLALAMGRRKSGDLKGAITDIDAYLKAHPQSLSKSSALFERGLAEAGLENYVAAAGTFKLLLAEDPKFPATDKVLYQLGWAYMSLEKPAEAVAIFTRLIAEHPNSPMLAEAHFHLGEDRYEKKQYAEALKWYSAAKRGATNDDHAVKAIYKLGWSHFQLKKYDQALVEFEELAKKYDWSPLASDALFMKAECLFKLEKYSEALPAYEQAKKATAATKPPAAKQPANDILTLILLHGGQSAAQLKQWEQSLQWLQGVVDDYPDSPYLSEALYEIGWAHDNLKQADKALASYEKAANQSRGATGARARFMMGEVYFKQKKYEQAIPHFQRVMYGFGGEQAGPDVKPWQAKSAYEAARCSDVRIKSTTDRQLRGKLIAQASKFYRYVIEKHPQSAVAKSSKTRVAQLAELK